MSTTQPRRSPGPVIAADRGAAPASVEHPSLSERAARGRAARREAPRSSHGAAQTGISSPGRA